MSNSTYIILSDEVLVSLLAQVNQVKSIALPRKRFAALCLQAIRNGEDDPARMLMPRDQIRELMTDPLNATSAALPVDTVRKLCWQAMNSPGPRSAPTSRLRYRAPTLLPDPGKRPRSGH